jgi:predicted RNA polymerase sigma factor
VIPVARRQGNGLVRRLASTRGRLMLRWEGGAYDKAIELAGNTAETAYLTRRRDQARRPTSSRRRQSWT